MKNLKLTLLFLLIAAFLNSCKLTQEVVWGAKIDRDEIIKDLLINEDGTQVVVVGEKYYYFLNDEKKMVQKLFLWDGKEKLEIHTVIQAKGFDIELSIYFKAKVKDLSKEQLQLLKSIDKTFNDKNQLERLPSIDLKGSRIKSNSALIKNKTDNFISTEFVKKEYEEAIFEDPTPPQIAGKILLTPFAVALDILLAPIYFIGILGAGIGGH